MQIIQNQIMIGRFDPVSPFDRENGWTPVLILGWIIQEVPSPDIRLDLELNNRLLTARNLDKIILLNLALIGLPFLCVSLWEVELV